MSGANEHSRTKEKMNIQTVGGQMVPTENTIEIPPQSAKKGPSTLDVQLGEGIELLVGDSKLNENGTIVDNKGNNLGNVKDTSIKEVAIIHLELMGKMLKRETSKSGISVKDDQR